MKTPTADVSNEKSDNFCVLMLKFRRNTPEKDRQRFGAVKRIIKNHIRKFLIGGPVVVVNVAAVVVVVEAGAVVPAATVVVVAAAVAFFI